MMNLTIPVRPLTRLTPTASGFEDNGLLGSLPVAIRARWSSDLLLSQLPVGTVLSDPGRVASYVCFPTTAIVSLLNAVELKVSAASAVVGNEGMIGIGLLMGGGSTYMGAVVNTGGDGFRMDATLFRKEIARSTVVLHVMLRFTQALMTQLAQTAVCNRHHGLSQQVSRLLLLLRDRSQGDELTVTQESIANMIGVRRESVSDVAHQLQREGLIRYSRGHVTVLDRPGLELKSCECYKVVKREYDRLLPRWVTAR